MSEEQIIENFHVDAKGSYLNYLQEAFFLARSLSKQTPEFEIPLPDGIPSKTTYGMSKLASLLHSAFVLASLREKLSALEVVLFKECVHRVKELLLSYDNHIVYAYYSGWFNKMIDLIDLLYVDDESIFD